ncbi:MAG: replication factor C large subunit [Candidatus Thermoplasmatota archaeon]|nr:replication factor C large subunit [Candidatus Thermoplasmatota archaeon]
MKAEIPWTEKYRPPTLEDVVGNTAAKNSMRKWAETWKGSRPPAIRALILSGPPGVGKTTSAIALARELGWDYIEMNASDKRSEKEIRRIVIPGSETNTFAATGDYYSLEKGKRHLIILDEADNIHSREDKGGIAAISDLIRNTLQPVVLIVNDLYELTRRSEYIKRASKIVKFENVSSYDIASVLHKIARSEGISLSKEAALRLIGQSEGDVRAAINDLQAISIKKTLTVEDVISVKKREKTIEMRDGIIQLFRSRDRGEARAIMSRFDEDPEHVSLWLDENLPYFVDSYEKLAAGYDMLARSSEFLNRAGKLSYYKFWSYASDLMAIGSGHSARESTAKATATARFPAILTRMGYRNSVIRSRASLMTRIGEYCHTSPRNAEKLMLPMMQRIFAVSEEFALSMMKRLSLSAEDLSIILNEPEDSEIVRNLIEKARSSLS